jgi:hypothetical protein
MFTESTSDCDVLGLNNCERNDRLVRGNNKHVGFNKLIVDLTFNYVISFDHFNL